MSSATAELLVRESKLAASALAKRAHESDRLMKQLCAETEALMDRIEFLNNRKLVSDVTDFHVVMLM